MPTDIPSGQLLARRKASFDTETALAAAKIVSGLARTQGLAAAICGGLAMHLYGFARATQGIDMVASGLLREVTPEKQLSYGGIRFTIEVALRRVAVDWIARDDFFRDFYEAALAEAESLGEGLHIISANWMVTLKYIAGREPDHIDLLWLLRQPGLVERAQVLAHFDRVMGPPAAVFPKREMANLFIQADVSSEYEQ